MSGAFVVATWNVEKGAADDPPRWDRAMGVLADIQPDVVLRQEMRGAELEGYARLFAEERRLDMEGYLAEADPEQEHPTDSGVFIRPELAVVNVYRHRRLMWHPVCNPVVLLPEAIRPLSLASVHLAYCSPSARLAEAEFLTTLGKPGMFTIIGGDFNSSPIDDAFADTEAITDDAFLAQRTLLPEPPGQQDLPGRGEAGQLGGRLRADVRPDRILQRVFVDAARQAADLPGSPEPLARRGGSWRADQGVPARIDRIYISRALVPALRSFEVIDTEHTRQISDHPPLVARFDRDVLIAILSAPTPAVAATVPMPNPMVGGVL